jgi:hypothetical protein
MNDRIEKFYAEAFQVFDKRDENYLEMFEKFAELLLKDCIAVCDETRKSYFKYRKESDDFQDKNIYAEGEAASDVIKYKIKKHFGIK